MIFSLRNRDNMILNRDNKIKNLNTAISLLSEKYKDEFKQKQNELTSALTKLDESKKMCSSLSKREIATIEELEKIKKDFDSLDNFVQEVLLKIKKESALLPSVVEWVDKIHEMIDNREAGYLITKKNPAPKAHDALIEAKAGTRQWRKQAIALKNQVMLYEAEAPWLIETLEYSVAEIIEGLNILEQERHQSFNEDPVNTYVTQAEWSRMSSSEKNQIALDRYFERRQKSPWLAGIMYERYIGSLYENNGYDVIYHGATEGVRDFGIDLVCSKGENWLLIQCKRLSAVKEAPVRENTVAQLYGSALVFSHIKNIDIDMVMPVLVTSYILSDEAKDFADILGVKYRENVLLERYPCIKCNIAKNGEKIYHLPFDQQYDVSKINKDKDERYVSTVKEAEALGFRRAFKWLAMP